jgi:hypothetical protein
MTRARERVGGLIATLGVLAMLVELVRHWMTDAPIQAFPVVIGALLGFVGFYLITPNDAKDAGGFVEGFTVKVLRTLRGGRATTEVTVSGPGPDDTEQRPKLTDNDSGVG